MSDENSLSDLLSFGRASAPRRSPKHYPTRVFVNEHGDRIAWSRTGRRHEIRWSWQNGGAWPGTVAEALQEVAELKADRPGEWVEEVGE